MNATWITLAVVSIIGITKLLSYLLGDSRKLKKLQERENDLEEKLRIAVKRFDTLRISLLERELKLVREDIVRITGKRNQANN